MGTHPSQRQCKQFWGCTECPSQSCSPGLESSSPCSQGISLQIAFALSLLSNRHQGHRAGAQQGGSWPSSDPKIQGRALQDVNHEHCIPNLCARGWQSLAESSPGEGRDVVCPGLLWAPQHHSRAAGRTKHCFSWNTGQALENQTPARSTLAQTPEMQPELSLNHALGAGQSWARLFATKQGDCTALTQIVMSQVCCSERSLSILLSDLRYRQSQVIHKPRFVNPGQQEGNKQSGFEEFQGSC